MKTSGARRIRSNKWNKLVKRVIFYVIMIGLFMRLSIRQKLTNKNGTNGKAVVLLRKEQGGKLPSLFLSFFFFSLLCMYRSRKIKLWSGLREPQRIHNDGWSGTNDSPVCDSSSRELVFLWMQFRWLAQLRSDIFLRHISPSSPFHPVASRKFRFCSRWEILESRFIRSVGGWCKCPEITF